MHLSARHGRTASWIALPLAIVASGAVIAGASYSAFFAATENAANTWKAGKITLTDNDNDSALFAADGLVPGSTQTKCITVSSSTTAKDTAVKLFTKDSSDTGLAEHIQMTIDRGTGDCGSLTVTETAYSGTLADLTAKTAFANGVGTWTPAIGDEDSVYRLTYTVDATTPNSAQDAAATTTFVWESQTS